MSVASTPVLIGPSLHRHGASRFHGVCNVIWLLRRVVSADPRSAGLWLGMSLLAGFVAPIELWAAKGAVDNLQDRLQGGASAVRAVCGIGKGQNRRDHRPP